MTESKLQVPLKSDETSLDGQWLLVDSRVVADETCQRIEWLISSQLNEIVSDYSGWETLYRDPNDGRSWELTYRYGYMHGGGPPSLRVLSPEGAREKYGDV
jgi:hypothetical protein